MKKFLLLQSMLIISAVCFGQTIQNITFSPTPRTDVDEVFVTVSSVFPSGSCNLEYQNFTVLGSAVDIYQFHCLGPLAVICYNVDSISVGVLPAGTYTATVNLMVGTFDGSGNCVNYTQTDQEIQTFDVAFSTNINENNMINPVVTVSKDQVSIGNLKGEFDFVVYDVAGKEIMNRKVSSTENTFSISAETGMYFYSLIKDGKKQFAGKILIK